MLSFFPNISVCVCVGGGGYNDVVYVYMKSIAVGCIEECENQSVLPTLEKKMNDSRDCIIKSSLVVMGTNRRRIAEL